LSPPSRLEPSLTLDRSSLQTFTILSTLCAGVFVAALDALVLPQPYRRSPHIFTLVQPTHGSAALTSWPIQQRFPPEVKFRISGAESRCY
jgi:hypothetical protein